MSFSPATSWPLVAIFVAFSLAAMVTSLAIRRLAGPGRRTIVALSSAIGLLLLLAALNPIAHPEYQPAGSHLAIVLDVSRSVQRAGDNWTAVRRTVGEALNDALSGLRPEVRRASTASLVVFASGVNVIAHQMPLNEVAEALSRLSPESLPPDQDSDIEAGLEAAAKGLEAVGRGAVILVSDGHETRGDARAGARHLARQGFAVHVVALGGHSPEMGLYAGDLPRQVEAERPTAVRLLLARLLPSRLSVNKGADRGPPLELVFRRGGETLIQSSHLPEAGWVLLRQPLIFVQPGLSFLDVELRTAGGQQQHRRFFTYVSSPPRVLVLGDDHRWTRVLKPENFRLETISPESLGEDFNPVRYDAVVLHEVTADRLGPSRLARLAQSVREAGLGLLLINGKSAGGPDLPTMLMSYDETPLEELLPLVNEPRPVLDEPPPRAVVLLIDTSASMDGWRLAKAKQIAGAIIHRLRGVDRLHLIAFTQGAHPLLSDLAMSATAKTEAIRVVGSLSSGGGTDPTQALEMIRDRRFDACGLFVISDGEFGSVSARPDCEATVFAIGQSTGGISSALSELAEPFPVPDDTFNPAGIQIGFFDPKPRDNHFEDGHYTPLLGADAFHGGWSLMPEPSLPLTGTAVTHAKDDAEVAAVRPRPRDPVLAFRDARESASHGGTVHGGTVQGGTVGAFTTELPREYYATEQGGRAVRTWIERLLAHAERDRYAFHIEDRGSAIDLRLTLLSKAGAVPRISRVSAHLKISGAGGDGPEAVPLALRPDPSLAGVFAGSLRLRDRPAKGVSGHLVVSEVGRDALRRPQRIPFDVPPTSAGHRIVGDEAWSFGLNGALLRDLARLSGGLVLTPGEEVAVLHGAGPRSNSGAGWPRLLGAAMLLLLMQVTVRRTLS